MVAPTAPPTAGESSSSSSLASSASSLHSSQSSTSSSSAPNTPTTPATPSPSATHIHAHGHKQQQWSWASHPYWPARFDFAVAARPVTTRAVTGKTAVYLVAAEKTTTTAHGPAASGSRKGDTPVVALPTANPAGLYFTHFHWRDNGDKQVTTRAELVAAFDALVTQFESAFHLLDKLYAVLDAVDESRYAAVLAHHPARTRVLAVIQDITKAIPGTQLVAARFGQHLSMFADMEHMRLLPTFTAWERPVTTAEYIAKPRTPTVHRPPPTPSPPSPTASKTRGRSIPRDWDGYGLGGALGLIRRATPSQPASHPTPATAPEPRMGTVELTDYILRVSRVIASSGAPPNPVTATYREDADAAAYGLGRAARRLDKWSMAGVNVASSPRHAYAAATGSPSPPPSPPRLSRSRSAGSEAATRRRASRERRGSAPPPPLPGTLPEVGAVVTVAAGDGGISVIVARAAGAASVPSQPVVTPKNPARGCTPREAPARPPRGLLRSIPENPGDSVAAVAAF